MPNTSTTIEGAWTYPKACAVISELRLIGAEAGITVGGVWVYFDLESQGLSVMNIVKSSKGIFCHRTFLEALTIERCDRIHRQRMIENLENLWSLQKIDET